MPSKISLIPTSGDLARLHRRTTFTHSICLAVLYALVVLLAPGFGKAEVFAIFQSLAADGEFGVNFRVYGQIAAAVTMALAAYQTASAARLPNFRAEFALNFLRGGSTQLFLALLAGVLLTAIGVAMFGFYWTFDPASVRDRILTTHLGALCAFIAMSHIARMTASQIFLSTYYILIRG